MTQRTSQKHRVSDFNVNSEAALVDSMDNLQLAESDDEDVGEIVVTKNTITENFDGESDEDISYEMGPEVPIERESAGLS